MARGAKPFNYLGPHRGTGDASVGEVAEYLVGGIGTAAHPRQLHIAQAGDAGTDWGIADSANPLVSIHSTTTPITDYLSLTHDGTNGIINSAGGNISLEIGGTEAVNLTATDLDVVAGNLSAGNRPTFLTTQPVGAVIMDSDTAPSGAITTAGAIFSSDTVVRKIIAAGTISNVET